MVFSTFRRSPLWPRQRGNVKEYNEVFDANVKRLQLQLYLPEEHLVKAYVGGLKDELRDSVKSFQPRTIGGARAYAQMEEWDLQQQAKKADEARRLAKVQEVSVAQNRVSTRQLSCLRQTGTLAEFNAKFDAISATLDLTEEYLVDIYMAALKDEIADSVQMFHPSTLGDARRLARLQEVYLQWLAKKAEKARSVLKDKEEGGCSQKSPQEVQEASKVQESGGSCLDSANECIKEQEASDCPDKNKTCSASSQECTETKETRGVSKLESSNDGSSLPVKTKDPVSSRGCDLSISSKSDSVLPRDNAKITSTFNGSLCFDSTEGFRSVLCHMDRCEAGNKTSHVSGFQLVPCRVIFSPAYPVFSTVQPAANKGLQLACIFLEGQKNVEGLQLDVTLFQQQQNFNGTMDLIASDTLLGLEDNSKQKSPITQHLGFIIPTRILIFVWFKGELVKMLLGAGFLQNWLSFFQCSPTQSLLH